MGCQSVGDWKEVHTEGIRAGDSPIGGTESHKVGEDQPGAWGL